MGMSIDKAIESLQILKNSWEVSLRNSLNETEREIDQDVIESLAAAIDTMRKYQKIKQIVEHWCCCGNPLTSIIAISEVVKDRDDD